MTTRRSSGTRRRRSPRRRKQSTFLASGRLWREVSALVLLILAIVSVIALFAPQAGMFVKPWHNLLSFLLGWGIAFAAPLLVGFALMLWMKSMPAERLMAATGASVVALALLGMFHLSVGGGTDVIDRGDGGGVIGYAVSGLFSGAIGEVGAWVVLVVLFAVGVLLYFNMTVGDVLAAWLQRREDMRADAEALARKAAGSERRQRPEPVPPPAPEAERPGLLSRVQAALSFGSDDDEPPVIVRRSRVDRHEVAPAASDEAGWRSGGRATATDRR